MADIFFPNDHVVNVKLIDKYSGRVVDSTEVTVKNLEPHLFLLRYMWDGRTVSGGVEWRHPLTGELYRTLTVICETTDPATGIGIKVKPPF